MKRTAPFTYAAPRAKALPALTLSMLSAAFVASLLVVAGIIVLTTVAIDTMAGSSALYGARYHLMQDTYGDRYELDYNLSDTDCAASVSTARYTNPRGVYYCELM